MPQRFRLEGRHPDNSPRYYEPHESDPPALTRPCKVCKAPIGSWCGGFGDIHDERLTPEELRSVQAKREEERKRFDADERG